MPLSDESKDMAQTLAWLIAAALGKPAKGGEINTTPGGNWSCYWQAGASTCGPRCVYVDGGARQRHAGPQVLGQGLAGGPSHLVVEGLHVRRCASVGQDVNVDLLLQQGGQDLLHSVQQLCKRTQIRQPTAVSESADVLKQPVGHWYCRRAPLEGVLCTEGVTLMT